MRSPFPFTLWLLGHSFWAAFTLTCIDLAAAAVWVVILVRLLRTPAATMPHRRWSKAQRLYVAALGWFSLHGLFVPFGALLVLRWLGREAANAPPTIALAPRRGPDLPA